MRKEIYMGNGLYKQVEVDEPSVSEQMQDELEPIIHPTQHDESDDLEAAKNEEMTEFEKAEYKRKIAGETPQLGRRSVWGRIWSEKDLDLEPDEKAEWRIVELEGGGFIRRPFPVKKAILAGPDRPETDSSRLIKRVEKHYFLKGEKWEHKYKNEV